MFKTCKWKEVVTSMDKAKEMVLKNLISISQELQRAKRQLSTMSDAMSHVAKITQFHANMTWILINLLESEEQMRISTGELVEKLKSEVKSLKPIEKAGVVEPKLFRAEELIEQLKVEVNVAAKGKYGAYESLASCTKKLEEESALVKSLKSELETCKDENRQAFKEKLADMDKSSSAVNKLTIEVRSLKQECKKTKEKLVEAQEYIEQLKVEVNAAKKSKSGAYESVASCMQKLEEKSALVESLKSELETCKDEKRQAFKENLAGMDKSSSSVNKLTNEVRSLKQESKKDIEKLAEAQESIERLRKEVNVAKKAESNDPSGALASSMKKLASQPYVRLFCKEHTGLSLAIRNDSVILAQSNPHDVFQHWVKAEKSNAMTMEGQIFALVNKATGQALKHSTDSTPVKLILYDFNDPDKSTQWVEGIDLGDGYKAIKITNTRLALEGVHALPNKVHDGSYVGLRQWHKGDNQRWKITSYS